MIKAQRVLKIENGLIVIFLVKIENEIIAEIVPESSDIAVADYGLAIKISDLLIPIPEFLIEGVIESPNLYIYYETGNYQLNYAFGVGVKKEALIESKAIYFYKKGQEGKSITLDSSAAETKN